MTRAEPSPKNYQTVAFTNIEPTKVYTEPIKTPTPEPPKEPTPPQSPQPSPPPLVSQPTNRFKKQEALASKPVFGTKKKKF